MLVAFDGTDAELFDSDGDTNVVRFRDLYAQLTGMETCYQPGPGTRFSKLGFIAGGALGLGWKTRVKESVKFAAHLVKLSPEEPVDGIGFSRGGKMLHVFAHEFHVKTGLEMRFFGAFDMVDSILLNAALRVLPKRVWYPPSVARPPARFVLHATGGDPRGLLKGGSVTAKWFTPTRIDGAEVYSPSAETSHSYRGRSDEYLDWMWTKFLQTTSSWRLLRRQNGQYL